jgi:hypothetical protein
MPKIRGIKPELWTDENFVELSAFARLLWIGLWNHACDNGHLQDKSKQIKMRILPTDDVNCADLLREIESQNLIERSDGWITIPNLTHHQKPHKRWYVTCDKPDCELPEGASYGYPKRDSTVEQPLNNEGSTVNNGGSTADGDVDCEVDGDGDVEGEVTTSAAAAAKKPTRATQRPADFRPSQAHIDLAAERGVDLRAEWVNFCDWCDAHGKTYKDWNAGLRTWIRKARPTRPVSTPPTRSQGFLALAEKLHAEERDNTIPFPQIGQGR